MFFTDSIHDGETLYKKGRFVEYLRKSREDKDGDTLAKHRQQLGEFIERQGFENVSLFEEVGSADSIDDRPVFKMILEKIEAGAFDGIIVIHADRLTRGSQIDAGRVTKAVKESNTLIITPDKVFDLANSESDEMLFEMQTFMARQEYRATKRRLVNGKINAINQGKWVNGGKPPYPYYYDRNDKKVKINEEQHKVYRLIVQMFINEHKTTEEIAVTLNKQKMPTITEKKGSVWHQSVVRNVLIGEFQLGYVMRNQTKWVNGKLKWTPEKVVKVEGNHDAVKTMEEHVLILKRFTETRCVPVGARRGAYILSGLIRCAKCGHTMAFRTDKNRKGEPSGIYLRSCRRFLEDGITRCTGSGVSEKVLLKSLYHYMKRYSEKLFVKDEDETPEISEATILIDVQKKELKKAERRLERITELYIDGDFTKNEFQERKSEEENKIGIAKAEIARLQSAHDLIDNTVLKDRKRRWREINLEKLFDLSNQLSAKDRNTLLKSVICKLNYERIGDDVDINCEWK